MAETDSTKTCKDCTYFALNNSSDIAPCRRYPSYQNRHKNEWCGEFSPIMLELPVVSLPMLDVEQDKQIEQTRNKGGRPRKVTRV